MSELKRYVYRPDGMRLDSEVGGAADTRFVLHEDAAAEIASLKRENERLSVRVHDLEVQQSVMRESFAQTEAMREQAEAKVGEVTAANDKLHGEVLTAQCEKEAERASGKLHMENWQTAVAQRDEARSQLAEAREDSERKARCLAFFRSVIKSGEPWTETCEREFAKAATVSREGEDGE